MSGRPPKFLVGDVVRVVALNGKELDDLDEPTDARALLGQEVVVEGARPDDCHEGWIIYARISQLGAIYGFPEGDLEGTGMVETEGPDGNSGLSPAEEIEPRVWRDDLMIDLETTTSDEVDVPALANTFADQLRSVADLGEIKWELGRSNEGQLRITLWAYPVGDARKAFGQVLSLLGDAYQRDDDESVFLGASWSREPSSASRMPPEIAHAHITYRQWTSPERLTDGPT